MVKRVLASLLFVLAGSVAFAQFQGPVQTVSSAPPVDTSCPGTTSIAVLVGQGANKGKIYCCTATGGGCTGTCWEECTAGPAGSGYNLIQDEDVGLTARTTINFLGAGVDCVDDVGSFTTDCTIPGGGGNHDLLSATHGDTLAAAVTRGSIIAGNTTPAWSELVIGSEGTYLRSDGTDPTWTAPGCEFLGDYADSGAGTDGDKWIVTATGWDKVKGGCVSASRFFYEIGHGAQLDFSDGTRLMCDGATFSLPSETRSTGNAMFLVPATGTFELAGCIFDPGVTYLLTGPCECVACSLDTEGGAAYFQVGTAGASGQPTFLIHDNTFRPPRFVDGGPDAFHFEWQVGSFQTRVYDNTFLLADNMFRVRASHGTANNTHKSMSFKDNLFDGLDYTNLTCNKSDEALFFSWNSGLTNPFVLTDFVFSGNELVNLDFGMRSTMDGSNFTWTNNTANGQFFDGAFTLTPANSWDYVHAIGNTCVDDLATTSSQGCEFVVSNTDHVTFFGNTWTSRGSPFVRLNSVNHALVGPNYMNRRSIAASASCVLLTGTTSNIRIESNLCIDQTHVLEMDSGGTYSQIRVIGNELMTQNTGNSIPFFIADTNGAACTDCVAYDNFTSGEDSTQSSWTDDLSEWDFQFNNHHLIDWEGNDNKITAKSFGVDDGVQIFSLAPSGVEDLAFFSSNTLADVYWHNPGQGSGGVALVSNADGDIRWGRALVVNTNATNVFDPDSTTDPVGLPWDTDLSSAFGMNLTTYAKRQATSGTNIYETAWQWPAGSTLPLGAEIVWGTNGNCTGTGTMEFLVCTTGAPACTPATSIYKRNTLPNMEAQFVYHAFGSQDSAAVAITARYTHDSTGGPSRCRPKLYGLRLSDATYRIVVPPTTDLDFDGLTSGTITIAAPDVAGSNVLTLPALTGTFAVEGGVGIENIS